MQRKCKEYFWSFVIVLNELDYLVVWRRFLYVFNKSLYFYEQYSRLFVIIIAIIVRHSIIVNCLAYIKYMNYYE